MDDGESLRLNGRRKLGLKMAQLLLVRKVVFIDGTIGWQIESHAEVQSGLASGSQGVLCYLFGEWEDVKFVVGMCVLDLRLSHVLNNELAGVVVLSVVDALDDEVELITGVENEV